MNHKYKLIMLDKESREWRVICTSGNKGYLENIAKGLIEDGEQAEVKEAEE